MEWKGGDIVELSETVALLSDKNHSVAYEALQRLQEASETRARGCSVCTAFL
ncbi:hypothetical protein [Enterococcus asini]|uniref:hypothetical protein n=1 Tax=Enterococcus asini TaxID=57732 RepID=UPI0032E465C6